MKYLIYILVLVALIGVTFGVFNVWAWHGLVPDLLLLVTIALALSYSNNEYLIFGLIGGVWFDVLYGLPIGSFAFPVIFSALLISFAFKQWIITEVKWYHFIIGVVFSTVFLHSWIWIYSVIIVYANLGLVAISGKQTFNNIGYEILANVLLAYPIYALVELVAKRNTSKYKL
jgi:cell shape-determining protein MreD